MEHIYLGSGTYGCVVYPPLIDPECGIEKVGNVGKIMDVEEGCEDRYADEEMQASEVLKDIDPEQRYFIYPFCKSYVQVRDVMTQVAGIKCEFLSKKNQKDQLPQLIMRHWGMPLQKYIVRKFRSCGPFSRHEMITFMMPVIKGIQKLIVNGYVHQDIKMNNIVVDKDEPRMIDFGLLMNGDSFYNENMLLDNQKYAINPPEYRMLGYSNLNEKTPSQLVKSELKLMREYIKTYWKLDCLWYSYYGLGNAIYTASMQKLQTDLMQHNDIEGRIHVLKEMKSIEKSDLYALGFILFQLSSLLKLPVNDRPDSVRYYKLLVHGLLNPCPEHRIDTTTAFEYMRHITD